MSKSFGKRGMTTLVIDESSLRAVRAGLALHHRVRELSAGMAKRTGQEIKLQTGISSGLLVAQSQQNGEFKVTGDAIQIEFVEGWAEHPLLAKAFADKLISLCKQLSEEVCADVPVLFTAHSVPCRTIQTPAPPNPVATPAEREKIFWPVANPSIPSATARLCCW